MSGQAVTCSGEKSVVRAASIAARDGAVSVAFCSTAIAGAACWIDTRLFVKRHTAGEIDMALQTGIVVAKPCLCLSHQLLSSVTLLS